MLLCYINIKALATFRAALQLFIFVAVMHKIHGEQCFAYAKCMHNIPMNRTTKRHKSKYKFVRYFFTMLFISFQIFRSFYLYFLFINVSYSYNTPDRYLSLLGASVEKPYILRASEKLNKMHNGNSAHKNTISYTTA